METVSPTAAGEIAPPTWIWLPATMIAVDAPIETAGGFPVTFTVPRKVGWRASRYP
jgi:hypothetical protein